MTRTLRFVGLPLIALLCCLPVLPALMLAAPASARTASSRCLSHFVAGRAPVLDWKHAVRTRLLCFRGFAVDHSGLTKTPLWSAEHLTPARVAAAAALPREGRFHAETRLPAWERAALADYRNSGFDRGHMAPAGDMPDRRAEQESFSLANVVPQAPCNNAVIWERIESAVRAYVAAGHDVYVVTGPIFEGASLSTIGEGVAVPTRLFKAIHDRGTGETGVYVARNSNDATTFEALPVSALPALAGIDPFPALPAAAKHRLMTLPPLPEARFGCRPR